MAIIWFTDQDRQRMRDEKEQCLERAKLFCEFVREEEPYRIANREASPKWMHKMMMLDIRPWPESGDQD
jgi:hypothetical protein